jgi:hypothetical protein
MEGWNSPMLSCQLSLPSTCALSLCQTPSLNRTINSESTASGEELIFLLKNPSKSAWELVCVTKPEGGLGVLDLKKQNEALMLKILDKFFNKRDTPWVSMIWEKHYSNGRMPNHTKNGSFWWRQNLKLLTSFKTSATVQLQSGNACSFWQDNWLQQPMQDQSRVILICSKQKYHSLQLLYS